MPRAHSVLPGAAALSLVLCLSSGCSQGSPAANPAAAAGVGGMGKPLYQGSAADLRVTPDGRFVAYLVAAEKPRLEGIPPPMLLGELYAAPVAGGAPRRLGSGVTNVPGGYLFSPDSRWVLFLSGYSAATQEGTLQLGDLAHPAAEPLVLGKAVTYMLASPDSKWVLFVDGGVLKVGELDKGTFTDVAGEVATAGFSPDSTFLLFKRRLSGASSLAYVPLGKWTSVRKLAEQVGEYAIAPDSRRVAFSQRSDSVRGAYDLYLASLPQMAPRRVALGTGSFAFSPDSRWLARTEGQRPDMLGNLVVGPAEGGAGRQLGEKVQDFSFAPDSTALAWLDHYQITARVGAMAVARLPDGKPTRVGVRVPNFTWGADGRFVAFLQRFLKPIYSVDLMLYPVGEEQALKVAQGVFGYSFTPANEKLLFRTNCIREGRACDLFALELARPKEASTKLVDAVYSFKSPEQGGRLLVTYARTDSQLFDVAAYNLKTGERKTLEQQISLPALFAAPDGSKVAYVVGDRDRPGVYLADKVP